MRRICVIMIVFVSVACGKQESTVGKFSRSENLPLHYLATDEDGIGALYRVDDVSVGRSAESTLVARDLQSPVGLTEDLFGNIYITELLATPDGRVLKILADSTVIKEYATNLDYPTGLITDAFNQLYILENGRHRIIKVESSGRAVAFKDTEIRSPEAAYMDGTDGLFLIERENDIVSRINPHGERQVVSPQIEGLKSVTIAPSGEIYILSVDETAETGTIFKILENFQLEEILTDLVNPAAIVADGYGFLYVSEGEPANRIASYNLFEGDFRVIVNTAPNPGTFIFTPF